MLSRNVFERLGDRSRRRSSENARDGEAIKVNDRDIVTECKSGGRDL